MAHKEKKQQEANSVDSSQEQETGEEKVEKRVKLFHHEAQEEEVKVKFKG